MLLAFQMLIQQSEQLQHPSLYTQLANYNGSSLLSTDFMIRFWLFSPGFITNKGGQSYWLKIIRPIGIRILWKWNNVRTFLEDWNMTRFMKDQGVETHTPPNWIAQQSKTSPQIASGPCALLPLTRYNSAHRLRRIMSLSETIVKKTKFPDLPKRITLFKLHKNYSKH